MSAWTYINGIVTVAPPGHGQRAMDFILGEVIDHLPRVTGSEGDMHVEIVRRPGYDGSCNHDEFGMPSNIGNDPDYRHWFREQGSYDLLLSAALRDRVKDETLREFVKWMNRLASRVHVEDMLVRVCDCYGWSKVFDGPGCWEHSQRRWSWIAEGHDGWSHRPIYSERHSANWRYGVMPKDGCSWSEYLVNLIPGGRSLAEAVDFSMGNLEWFEYGQTRDEIRESMGNLDSMRSRIEEVMDWLGALEKSFDE